MSIAVSRLSLELLLCYKTPQTSSSYEQQQIIIIIMAKATSFSILILISSFLSVGGNSRAINAQKTWCVAKPSSDQGTLVENLNFACSEVDCNSVLQIGLPCHSPDNLMNHASIAMNLYYQCKGRNRWNCDFKNSAIITLTDPSYGNCVYQ